MKNFLILSLLFTGSSYGMEQNSQPKEDLLQQLIDSADELPTTFYRKERMTPEMKRLHSSHFKSMVQKLKRTAIPTVPYAVSLTRTQRLIKEAIGNEPISQRLQLDEMEGAVLPKAMTSMSDDICHISDVLIAKGLLMTAPTFINQPQVSVNVIPLQNVPQQINWAFERLQNR